MYNTENSLHTKCKNIPSQHIYGLSTLGSVVLVLSKTVKPTNPSQYVAKS